MDVLVVLGTTAAYLFSVFNGFFAERLGLAGSGLYFEASAIIITLVLLGRFLEEKAKGKTSAALKKLMQLQPATALVQRGAESIEIAVEDMVPGDHVLLRPGDRVPVDGKVISGSSAVDESAVTGESMPVEKAPGDQLISGSVNSYGSLIFEAEKVGRDSVLSRIIAIVEEAQGSKAPIQKLADRIAAIFVPAVLLAALLTLVLWLITGSSEQAILSAVAVLVIACPCALGLATPTAIMVGTGVGAGRGILIKNAEILQSTSSINAVVLDKTGTLTRGKPNLQSIIPVNETGRSDEAERTGEAGRTGEAREAEVLALAASLEQHSEHPLARALVRAAGDRNLSLQVVTDFTAKPGKGITGKVDNVEYRIGTASFLQDTGLDLTVPLYESSLAKKEAA